MQDSEIERQIEDLKSIWRKDKYKPKNDYN